MSQNLIAKLIESRIDDGLLSADLLEDLATIANSKKVLIENLSLQTALHKAVNQEAYATDQEATDDSPKQQQLATTLKAAGQKLFAAIFSVADEKFLSNLFANKEEELPIDLLECVNIETATDVKKAARISIGFCREAETSERAKVVIFPWWAQLEDKDMLEDLGSLGVLEQVGPSDFWNSSAEKYKFAQRFNLEKIFGANLQQKKPLVESDIKFLVKFFPAKIVCGQFLTGGDSDSSVTISLCRDVIVKQTEEMYCGGSCDVESLESELFHVWKSASWNGSKTSEHIKQGFQVLSKLNETGRISDKAFDQIVQLLDVRYLDFSGSSSMNSSSKDSSDTAGNPKRQEMFAVQALKLHISDGDMKKAKDHFIEAVASGVFGA